MLGFHWNKPNLVLNTIPPPGVPYATYPVSQQHLIFFPQLAIVDKTCVDIYVQIFVWIEIFSLFFINIKDYYC